MKKYIDDRMMTTSRDSLLVRKSALFTIHVHFYACKNQIKPKMFLSHAMHITIISRPIQP